MTRRDASPARDRPRRSAARARRLRYNADITEVAAGSRGLLCGLAERWPASATGRQDRELFHVYLVRDGRIAEIEPYDDRAAAARAAGVA